MAELEQKRYRVRLENEHGIAAPDAYLEEEPSEGDEITLEDGTPALVRYLLTLQGATVIAAKRLPRE